MDKALDDIIKENNTGLRRFRRGQNRGRGQRRNFRSAENRPFRNGPQGFNRDRNRNQRMNLDRPLSARNQNQNRGGRRRYVQSNNGHNRRQNFGYNDYQPKVCNIHNYSMFVVFTTFTIYL